MKNTYNIKVRQYDASPATCNDLIPHWDETFTSIKSFKARAKEIADEIRTKRGNHWECIISVYKNGNYYGEFDQM